MVYPNYNAKGMFFRSLTLSIYLQLNSREFDPRSDHHLVVLYFFVSASLSSFRFSLPFQSVFAFKFYAATRLPRRLEPDDHLDRTKTE